MSCRVVRARSHLYRLNHPLAEALFCAGQNRDLPPVEIYFNYSTRGQEVSILEPLIGVRLAGCCGSLPSTHWIKRKIICCVRASRTRAKAR